jgi:hypothetical protein
MKFYLVCCYFLIFKYKPFSAPYNPTLNPCSSPYVTDRVSKTHKTTRKLILHFLYTLRAFVKLGNVTISFVMSVRIYVMSVRIYVMSVRMYARKEKLSSHWKDFHGIRYLN